jgi:glycosyltransferase involved in cell wall biosynthesis
LGNVVLEAWAHGVPVVAARSSGPASLIKDGQTGLLAAMEDHAGLAQALNAVLGDQVLAARLGRSGLSHYQATFSRDAVLTRYMGFFETVARRCAA